MRLRNYYFQIAVSLYATLYFFHHANILIMLYIVLNYKKKFEYGFDMFVIFDFSRLGGGGGAVVQYFIKFCHLLQISNLQDGFGSPRVWPSLYCHSTFNNFA